ncbi:hypothetical protein AB0N73_11970 [Microbacterium sp. NPDC089189]|uniref:hypothetical protein n=1 Tax=Microbacterium sp. NPDC089189 TaxID=3154972 RepID=UPI0034135046
MADDPRTVMQQLTDTTTDGPVFFIAALPWVRAAQDGEPAPQRGISLVHAAQTLADYATLDQLTSHVGMGYNSLLIGQRIGLMRGGEVAAAWPVDNTGWPWSGTREKGAAWAFRADSTRGYQRHPTSSRGIVVSHGDLTDVIDAVAAASAEDPDETFVVAGQCYFQPHWH